MKHQKVFIVEDDLISAQYLKEVLEGEGYQVNGIVDSGEEAIRHCREEGADVVLMDIILKGAVSGSEAAVRIKRHHPECRIIFLTAYADEEMIDYAIEAKAVAYLMKPYREREILATVKVALAQEESPVPDSARSVVVLRDGYVFDLHKRRLGCNGEVVPLSPQKLKLIEVLVRNRNSTVSNEQICRHVWDEPKSNSTLRSLVKRLRAVLGDDLIVNVNGLGYTIAP